MSSNLVPEDIARLKIMSKFFKGFSDYSRLSILRCLMEDSKTVSEIQNITGFSQPKISNHLKNLRDCELVVFEQDGKYVHYSIKDERIKEIILLAEVMLKDFSEENFYCMKY